MAGRGEQQKWSGNSATALPLAVSSPVNWPPCKILKYFLFCAIFRDSSATEKQKLVSFLQGFSLSDLFLEGVPLRFWSSVHCSDSGHEMQSYLRRDA